MKEKDFEKKVQKITDELNQLYDESNKTVGFVLLCGYEDKPKDGQLLFRVAGAGELTQLALITYAAAKDDERFSIIFDTAIKLREEKKEQELIPFNFFPTIDRSFGKEGE